MTPLHRVRLRLTVAIVAVASLLASCGGNDEADLSVLFIGNSHTSTNDLPGMLRTFASDAGYDISVETIARDGYRLSDHVESGDAIEAIRRGVWDYVVLQEQSVIPGLRSERSTTMLPAVSALARETRVYEAQPLLLLTWGWDQDLEQLGFRDYRHMQMSVNAGTQQVAEAAEMPIAPVGAAWSLARAAGISLYQDDGIHPDITGTYLATAVLFATIFEADPRPVGFDADLAPVLAQSLRKFAGETAHDDRKAWTVTDE